MTWAGAISALETALTTAAATVNALDTSKEPFDVKGGPPFSATSRQVRYWYEGDQESTSGGNTLTRENVEERITIRWYWPVISRDDAWQTAIEIQLQAANRATHSALLGDAHLGEHAIALRIDETTTGWESVGEAWLRTLDIPIRIDMAEVSVIAN
jgi:hypothetical protein